MSPRPNDPRTDEELVDAANAGDGGAFEALYERHRDWIVGLAFRMTGDRDEALDILQETIAYWLRKFPGFELRGKVRTFLYPVVRSLSISAGRRARRTRPPAETLPERSAAAPPRVADDECTRLAVALAELPEAQREVLILRVVDGLTVEEVATALEIPSGTAKSRLHHALEALRAAGLEENS